MNSNFWFVVGSQDLYGEEVLKTVAQRAEEMAWEMSKRLPYPLIYKVTAMSNAQITEIVKEANYDDTCAGRKTYSTPSIIYPIILKHTSSEFSNLM